MRTKIGFIIVMMLVLLTNTVYAHDDANTANSLLHGIQHLLMSRDYLLGILGAGLFAALLGGRAFSRWTSS
jgi:hydrogenase/urease accessory protein HupE